VVATELVFDPAIPLLIRAITTAMKPSPHTLLASPLHGSCSTPEITLPRIRNPPGATMTSAMMKAQPTRKPTAVPRPTAGAISMIAKTFISKIVVKSS
jgi:hypothetical protein